MTDAGGSTVEDEQGPEKLVMIDGDRGAELLHQGEVEATLLEHGEDDLKRTDVKIINTAGPHPIYARDSTDRESPAGSKQSLKKRIARHSVWVGFFGGMMYLSVRIMAAADLTMNGEPIDPPGTAGILLLFVFVLLIYYTTTRVPYMGSRGWSA